MLLIRSLFACVCIFGVAAAQDSRATTLAARYMPASRIWSMVLPEGWRQMTPDEARQIQEAHPGLLTDDMLHPRPGAMYHLGPVERWLAGENDGESLAVIEQDTAPDVDLDALHELEHSLVERARVGAIRFEILAAQLTKVGESPYPAMQIATIVGEPPHQLRYRTLELYIPTSGRLVGLKFRAPESGWTAAEPRVLAAIRSLTFARPPSEPRKAGNRIFYAAIAGALVGLMLALLRKRARRA